MFILQSWEFKMKFEFIIGTIFSTALMLTGCATTSETSQQTSTEAWPDEGETAEGTPFRCERIQITGTRRFERICYSREQWEAMAENTQDNVRVIQDADRGTVRATEFPCTSC